MAILVTGASGFVGRHAVTSLLRSGCDVKACVRNTSAVLPEGAERIVVPDLGVEPPAASSWRDILKQVTCVLHIAGRAHSNPAGDARQEAEFRRVNVTATQTLARAAADAGVARFVFVSSIGVNGSSTRERPFTEQDPPAPSDFYAITKLEAEECLRQICGATGMALVIVRPTLVAGPDAPGNLARMVALVRKGIPLPIGGVHNKRSLVGVNSLATLLALSCTHPAAAGRLFLAADAPALSTSQIVMEIAGGLGLPARIWNVPMAWLTAVGSITGRSRDVAKLCGSLEVDAAAARATLGWQPELSIREELRALGAAARQLAMRVRK